jgi:membrane protein DedA with SNARE-associated domain
MSSVLVFGAATPMANKFVTFLGLFVGEILAWAGVPAVGAASAAAAGALASQGKIHLWAVIVVGTAGAEIGSMIGWWVGNRVVRGTLERHGSGDAGAPDDAANASKREKALDAGQKVADKWGPLIVFFVPSWVPGGLGMQFRRFLSWNLLACLLWNAGAALSAYGIGSAASGGSFGSALVPLIIGVLCVGAVYLLIRAFFRRRQYHSQPGGVS